MWSTYSFSDVSPLQPPDRKRERGGDGYVGICPISPPFPSEFVFVCLCLWRIPPPRKAAIARMGPPGFLFVALPPPSVQPRPFSSLLSCLAGGIRGHSLVVFFIHDELSYQIPFLGRIITNQALWTSNPPFCPRLHPRPPPSFLFWAHSHHTRHP